MISNDMVNGAFELIGAAFLLLNTRQVLRHKMIKGVHWGPLAFFSSWGIWNLWFYPSLGQWLSFTGGAMLVVANLVYLGFVIKYWNASLA
jgi:hypothetical protein